MYLKVEPPSRSYYKEYVLYIDLEDHPIQGLDLAARLLTKEPLDWEDLDANAIAECPDPGTDKGREAMLNSIHETNASKWVELLNFVLWATGKEVSQESTFQVVDSME